MASLICPCPWYRWLSVGGGAAGDTGPAPPDCDDDEDDVCSQQTDQRPPHDPVTTPRVRRQLNTGSQVPPWDLRKVRIT